MNLWKWAAGASQGHFYTGSGTVIGICGLQRRRIIKNILEAGQKASRWLWIKRGDESGHDHPRLGRPVEGV